MRFVALGVLTTLMLAGCLGASSPDTTAIEPPSTRLAIDEWRALLSQPIFETVTETFHSVTAEDGTHLALTLFLPDGAPADAQLATVLEITPYQTLDRGFSVASIPLTDEGASAGSGWQEQVLRGMAFVRADARGTHGSAGCLDFGGSADRNDAILFMDWIRAQPWSNGRIVTDGVSHPGMGSMVAHTADPLLTGAIATAGVASYYTDEYFQGAHYDNQFNGPAYQAIELAPGTTTRPDDLAAQAAPCTGETTTDYDLVDGTWGPLWQDRDLALAIENAQANGREYMAPMLLNHGFDDLNVQPDNSQIYWDALNDDSPKSMIIGYWYHAWPDFDGHPANAYSDWRQRYFDHYLLGIENGMQAEPRVLLEDSQGVWHESHDWPLTGSEHRMLWLDSDGLTSSPAKEATVSYRDPSPDDQDRPDGRVLFRSETMPADVLITGAPYIELIASSDADETKWVVFVYDEAPDGSREHITHGMADSHRMHDRDVGWTSMTPGVAKQWRIDMLPTGQVVEEGHRIVVEIASQWSNQLREEPICFDDHRGGNYCPIGILPGATAGTATQTIHLGPKGTSLHFDAINPKATDKPKV
jgi:X-Pro dipeptidyl-peptidase